MVRQQALAEIIASLEAYAAMEGTYRVDGGGSNQNGQGWFLFEGGRYVESIANVLVNSGLLSDPAPRDPLHTSTNSTNHDFMVYRCLDRIAVFSEADSIQPVTQDLDWWTDNGCRTSPMTVQGRTYFQLSVPLAEVQSEPSLDQYTLVFSDEFSGSALDPNKWDTGLLWGPYKFINNEEQMYIDTHGMHAGYVHDPFTVSGGTLKITATPTSASLRAPVQPPENDPAWQPYSYAEYVYNPAYNRNDVGYLSGIISSYESFKMTHGYVEARVKLPQGQGLWPAFWMLPTHYVEDVPEIDVMEFLGHDVNRIYHTYHYFDTKNGWQHHRTPEHSEFNNDWTEEFHTFGMAWSPRQIRWYVDGVETFRTTDSELDIAGQSMYLLANLAVGGNWPGSPDATTSFPAVYEIDYIRAYKKTLNSSLKISRDYQLMFRDEFNGKRLNASKWNTHFLWGPYLPINNEEQYYVDALGSDSGKSGSPFTVANGILTINARAAEDPEGFDIPATVPSTNDPIWEDYPTFQRNLAYTPGSYSSGIITSYDAFKFAHGYAEIRARVPEGDGLWPAFWLLNGYYVSQQPEMDVMEILGEDTTRVVHSYHRLNDIGIVQSDSWTSTNSSGFDGSFHRYGVRWRPGRIDWYVDRQLKHSYIADDVGYQLMYVIANLAVGGDFNTMAVDPAAIPAKLDIDYIRVWQELDPE